MLEFELNPRSRWYPGLFGDTWVQTGKLRGGDIGLGDFFGESVSICGDRVLIGAHAHDNNYINSGAAYVFELADDMWDETAMLTASAEEYSLIVAVLQ